MSLYDGKRVCCGAPPPKAFAAARRSAKSMASLGMRPVKTTNGSRGNERVAEEGRSNRRTLFSRQAIIDRVASRPAMRASVQDPGRVSVMNDKVEGPNTRFSITDQEALQFHSRGRPGKLEIMPTKPMATQRDLSLAYSPGVAVPVKAIHADPSTVFDYTTRGNMVAVITNGTAILGLGNLGALASKPVMEGKAVLFKGFADIDSIDLELATEDVNRFIDAVELMEPSFGGINLEDIKAPECFVIEQTLRERMNIPVFHDDQHGTAIISAAGLINAAFLTGRELKDMKVVVNGAGAASISCTELAKALGVAHV